MKENEEVKKYVLEDKFNIGFHEFLNSLTMELNNNRSVPLTDDELYLLIDNIFRDYPELIASIKYNSLHNLETDELYQQLYSLIHNQIKMGNLFNKPKGR